MNIVNIYHKSRDVIYELNFQANGETAWSFTAEGDGEIYDVELENIDSYTIDGNYITLPFSISDKTSYQIQVVKNVDSHNAIITFKSRRNIEKLISQNIPNFSIGDGRYLYVLSKEANKIYRFDVSLLVPSNYSGNGVWIINPLISEINLPTIIDTESDGGWADFCYLTTSDLFVFGWSASEYKFYGCLISTKDSDIDTVYNLEKSLINSYSTLSSMQHQHHKRDPNGLLYDYIKNYLFVNYRGVYWSMLYFDVNNQFEYLNHIPATKTTDIYVNKIWFDPINEHFLGLTDFVLVPEVRRTNCIYYNQIYYGCIFDRFTGYRWKPNNNSYSRLYSFDSYGIMNGAIVDDSAGVGSASTNISFSQKFGTSVIHGGNKFLAANVRDYIRKSWSVQDTISGQGSPINAFGSDFNGNHFFIDNVNNKRLFIIDFTEKDWSNTENPQFGYYDFNNTITRLYCNQLL